MVYRVKFGFRGYWELQRLQMGLKPWRLNDYFYLSVCEKFKRLAVLVGNNSKSFQASCIQIYSFLGNGTEKKLEYKTELDISAESLTYYRSICFSRYIGDKLIVCGYTYENSTVHTYFYDIFRNELAKRESKCLGEEDKYCYKLQRYENEVYGTLSGGKVLKFNFSVVG